MKMLNTVRFSYLYIVGGSVLISGCVLAGLKVAAELLYAHYVGDPSVIWIRIIHWIINHIGQIPASAGLFLMLFALLYMLRSQKIAADLEVIVRAVEELANTGQAHEIQVLSTGELGRIAASLNRLEQVTPAAIEVTSAPSDMPALGRSQTIQLLVRNRSVLHYLRESQKEGLTPEELRLLCRAAAEDAQVMERFLEDQVMES